MEGIRQEPRDHLGDVEVGRVQVLGNCDMSERRRLAEPGKRRTHGERGRMSCASQDTPLCLMNVQACGWAAVASPARYRPGGGVKMS